MTMPRLQSKVYKNRFAKIPVEELKCPAHSSFLNLTEHFDELEL